MKELLEYREKLLSRFVEAAQEFCAACESFSDPSTKTEGEWTVHQMAAHVRDVDRHVYGERIRRTLNEEMPGFRTFDADTWMTEHYNRDESLKKILSEFMANVDDLLALLRSMPVEGWSRLSHHETLGGEPTLQFWVERSLAHIEEHLHVLKKVEIP